MTQSNSPPESPMLAPARTVRDIFPPVTKQHIMNCSYPVWHSVYRSLCPKSRTIPLTPEFLQYLRADGIVLPADEQQVTTLSDSEDEDEQEQEDEEQEEQVLEPTQAFPDLHQKIKATIKELGGAVAPKLNWSSPKDATFMTPDNTFKCNTPGEIYLLLKSSDFITHDLEYAFDDCIDSPIEDVPNRAITALNDPENLTYSLILRKWFQINPSMEFRCFVRNRRLLAISQREPNHFPFLHGLRRDILVSVNEFFEENLRHTFPNDAFVFDVYIPLTNPDERRKTWLIDINPFAPRTDPILFSWSELLEIPTEGDAAENRRFELRLVNEGDPEAYTFNTAKYSTSKMPQEVVEAGLEGEESVWEFAKRWREIVDKMEGEKKEGKEGAGANSDNTAN